MILEEDVRTQITIDKRGSGAEPNIEEFISVFVDTWWDEVDSRFLPRKIGNAYILTFRSHVITTKPNTRLKFEFEISGVGAIVFEKMQTLKKDEETVFTATAHVFVGGGGFILNGGKFYFTALGGDVESFRHLLIVQNTYRPD